MQVEEHLVDGERKRLLVHRKGSTRAFPPHHPLIPVDYQLIGQPVLIGGSMGTCSYVLTGILYRPCSVDFEGRPGSAGCAACPQRMHAGSSKMMLSEGGHDHTLHVYSPSPHASTCWPRCTKAIAVGLRTGLTDWFVFRHRAGHAGNLWQHLPRGRTSAVTQQQPQQPDL